MKNSMNFVFVSQRVDHIGSIDEKRDSIDQQLIKWLIYCNFIPLPVPNYLVNDNKTKIILNKIFSRLNPIGIVLSGGNNVGNSVERDKVEKFLLNISIKENIPVLGICRGFQYMNTFLGGTICQIKNHVKTKHPIQVINKKFGNWPNEVNSYHEMCINKLANDFNPICIAKDGTVEAAISTSLKWEGWMWHPEREKNFNTECKQRIINLFRR